MNPQDLFVGAVAIGIGTISLSAAIFDWDWYLALRKAKWLEQKWGRPGARVFFAGVGLLLIGLGIGIGFGFGPFKSADRAGAAAGP